jgi:cell division inhibitor SepF
MNLDELEIELGQRILDFVGGAVYSLNGDIKKVARSIFVVAPSNVDVSQNIAERSGRENFKRFD